MNGHTVSANQAPSMICSPLGGMFALLAEMDVRRVATHIATNHHLLGTCRAALAKYWPASLSHLLQSPTHPLGFLRMGLVAARLQQEPTLIASIGNALAAVPAITLLSLGPEVRVRRPSKSL